MGKRETSRGFSSTSAITQTVNNSSSEVTVFSQVVPANKMGTSKKLTLSLLGTLTTPAISIPTFTVKIKLGSSVLTIFSGLTLAASQNNTPFVIDGIIRNKDAANAQIVYAKATQYAANLPMLLANATAVYSDWTVDTTVDQTLSVTIQFGALSAGTTFTLRDVDLDLS